MAREKLYHEGIETKLPMGDSNINLLQTGGDHFKEMKEYLVEIEKILLNKRDVETYEGLTSEVLLNPAASTNEIVTLESSLYNKIPNHYINFLRHYNGGIFFKVEDFAGFRLFGIEEIGTENTFQKENFGEDWNDEVILFCSCVGDNEYLGFKILEQSYQIVHCIMEQLPEEWMIVEYSFDHFLLQLIRERGRKYWLD